MEPLKCKCCGAPLKNDVCSYCGVSYRGIPTNVPKSKLGEIISKKAKDALLEYVNDYLNGGYREPKNELPPWTLSLRKPKR